MDATLYIISSAARSRSQDPICRLSDANKLRLCTSVFSASVFKNKIKFLPTLENIVLNCEKKEVRAFHNCPTAVAVACVIDASSIYQESDYIEWVIGCRVLTYEDEPELYYISRSHMQNAVYLYKKTSMQRRVLLYLSLIHISEPTRPY